MAHLNYLRGEWPLRVDGGESRLDFYFARANPIGQLTPVPPRPQ